MQCYYPLGGEKRDEIFKSSTIAQIAAKHAVTAAQVRYLEYSNLLKQNAFFQVCIGFNTHCGCSVVPKSVNVARIIENFSSSNLHLDENDMKCLK